MEHAPGVYSGAPGDRPGAVAQALRSGGPPVLRQALHELREATIAAIQAYADALGPALRVPQAPGLNPPLWEWGHVAWFEQWWIARNPGRPGGEACDPHLPRPPPDLPGADALYDSSRVAHGSRWSLPLPGLPATRAWLDATRRETLALLEALPPEPDDAALYFFRLAAQHEAMHLEAAGYMARALGFALPLPEPAGVPGPPRELQVPAQAWRLGVDGPGFAFDNERGAHAVALAPFAIDDRPVSWRRFAGFVEAGGYADPRWWTDEGWAWRLCARPPEPAFPQGEAPAVQLSAHEAEAWCRWAGRRLPTEGEWECAALTQPGLHWGRVWEWTASAFLPYPGFVPHPYRDYSQPWFGSHRVLRGASDATPAVLAHPRFRNFFLPGRTDILAGFRSCA